MVLSNENFNRPKREPIKLLFSFQAGQCNKWLSNHATGYRLFVIFEVCDCSFGAVNYTDCIV
eukprot:scaffold48469_cov36-Cyclotella_meneghiniana.AAC.1